MEGQKAILDKIILEAKEKAKVIESDAKAECDARIADADVWAEKYTAAQTEILKKEIDSIVSGKELNAGLDVKKATLKAKREILDEAFSLAYEKLCKVDKKSYLKLVKSLIDENADDGDVIVLSSDMVLSEEDFALDEFKAKNLKIAKERGDFKGGVILTGKKSDKDLTFERVIEDRKEDLTALCANILFG